MSLPLKAYPSYKLRRYQLWTYDIWGNARDGFEVNNRYKCGTIEIKCKLHVYNAGTDFEFADYSPTDLQLSRAVKPNKTIRLSWEGETEYTLYASNNRNGCPICELEFLPPK